jgi:hypothetical protein
VLKQYSKHRIRKRIFCVTVSEASVCNCSIKDIEGEGVWCSNNKHRIRKRILCVTVSEAGVCSIKDMEGEGVCSNNITILPLLK